MAEAIEPKGELSCRCALHDFQPFLCVKLDPVTVAPGMRGDYSEMRCVVKRDN